jgi:hypothetical protein
MEPEKKKWKVVDLNTKLNIVKHLDEGHNIKATVDNSTFPKEQCRLLRRTKT